MVVAVPPHWTASEMMRRLLAATSAISDESVCEAATVAEKNLGVSTVVPDMIASVCTAAAIE